MAENVAHTEKQVRSRLTNTRGGDAMASSADILFENEFVGDTYKEVPQDKQNAYQKHYTATEEKKKKSAQISAVKAMNEKPGTTSTALMDRKDVYKSKVSGAPLQFNQGPLDPVAEKANLVEKKRKIFFDSGDRDTDTYPDASDFVISCGRIFHNVKSMRLVSLEFPNVVKAIDTLKNNQLYWINIEDDSLDPPYPVYTATVSPGSYSLTTLQTELTTEMAIPFRKDGQVYSDGTFPIHHLFVVTVNLETNYVGFTSLVAQPCGQNPITTTGGSTLISLTQNNHGYVNGQLIYILGVVGILGGLQASDINGSYNITVIEEYRFTFNILVVATSTVTGGGTLVKTGREAPFQFLFGENLYPLADIIGFPVEYSSITIEQTDPITSNTKNITGIITGEDETTIVCPDHRILPGDRVNLVNVHVTPSIYQNEKYNGILTVYSVPSPDVFTIRYGTQHVSDISTAFVRTQTFQMYYPGHGFNRSVDITQIGPNLVQITTLFPHGFISTSTVLLRQTNSVPNVDGFYNVILIPNSLDTFAIQSSYLSNPLSIVTPGFSGILTSDQIFYLTNVTSLGGFTTSDLNNVPFTVRDVIDENNFTFSGIYGFSQFAQTGGGSGIRINSKIHGWRGTQSNNDTGSLYKPVRMSGDNYAFMCCPGLNSDSISNSGPVEDI
ncbi:hypothetical protein BDK51DRAFT_38787 [Blyttiomyces helicus]|uniref:Uncharacterized protein n=1 Tax=Blyttiomyces helicus TaxID=388810 RepID=A0A4P9WTA8_9FUNG|nr:hypothetical protein BDK51DRAFT_38787 [Blyttiomyces helicus]|eukprot:RKO94580.1 hypothetical protein BDK51DRAFT_38787 [Blyttiomyces helicus]